ncbi:hypothetical protein GA0070606_0371 [Micromonospora citrea]|uniref:Uncharacterized protein n=1 Tax=Micromonospora citrea TaxID=47855 RepID=A0A1C6TSJ5_9ACTN|nr:hypothetical protein [Micromonospora citrea]SCL44613.1 hypothetical protein GA0070606_0371 [Micromonospora citrea]
MPRTRRELEQERMHRRLEILRLPVAPLRHAGYLAPDRTDRQWERVPEAVGVGPDNQAVAVWASREQPRRRLITVHDGGRRPVRSVQLDGCVRPWFVQPLPGDRILLVRARNQGGANAEVWTADGRREHRGDLGDAIAHVSATPTGAIWVGYFDEAMAGSGPQAHGLARFTADLEPDWLYPQEPALPEIFDCYALNVADEAAWTCAYTQFHLVSVTGGRPTDHGQALHRGAYALLTDGVTGAFIGGYGPDYDLVVPFRIERAAVTAAGAPARLVLPDGMEIRNARTFGRGPELHVIVGTSWYRTDLGPLASVA